jgi:hypothetical protein
MNRWKVRFHSRFLCVMSVGVMKDYKLKLRNLHVSHTLGWSRNWNISECDGWGFVYEVIGDPSIFKRIRKSAALARVLPTLTFRFVVYYESRKWEVKIRQNKLEIPRDKDEVNKWEIHECDERAHNPEAMVDSCLLWINKARAKDKMYIWVSVWWKTTI